MHLVKVPLRIPILGGGTDIKSWYEKNGSFFVSAAINKYIYISGHERLSDNLTWLSYSKNEVVKDVNDIKHEILREILKMYKSNNGIEIHSISDLPSHSGLGSSGSFTVGLLMLMNNIFKYKKSLQSIAETAIDLNTNKLGKNSGKQDEYIAAFGGVKSFKIQKNGTTKVKKFKIKNLREFDNNLFLFNTERGSSEVMLSLIAKNHKKSNEVYLKNINIVSKEMKSTLIDGNINEYGKLLDEHWKIKKSFSKKMSNSKTDELYDQLKRFGATGGKIIGAGGGGCFLCYVPKKNNRYFRKKIQKLKITSIPFSLFDNNEESTSQTYII